jgi:hypothetical protein
MVNGRGQMGGYPIRAYRRPGTAGIGSLVQAETSQLRQKIFEPRREAELGGGAGALDHAGKAGARLRCATVTAGPRPVPGRPTSNRGSFDAKLGGLTPRLGRRPVAVPVGRQPIDQLAGSVPRPLGRRAVEKPENALAFHGGVSGRKRALPLSSAWHETRLHLPRLHGETRRRSA